ncbi:MAG: HDOD domain-containing protein [Porticoccaceae bacterium]|nr:HDOD domain-containing protein [Pseudomonadales bacterium]MCP5171893.1 HDOD domain-containing protein [Pseudomonadales bacterium]
MDVNVARQPIFNQQKELAGYELLFREDEVIGQMVVDGDSKTSSVISNSYFSIGLEKLLGGKRGYINFIKNLLIEKFPLLLPRQSIVVEILEDIDVDDDLIEACQELCDSGYTLALDDFVFSPELLPLVTMAKIIKFDFLISTPEEIRQYLAMLPADSERTLLAEKIETNEQFDLAKGMGFQLFQGFFFCRPEIIKGAVIPDVSLKLLQVVAEVNQKDFNIDKLEELIEPDISITYKLLRYINSAYYALETRISSIKQAITYLGQNEIRRFVSMVALSNLSEGKPDEIARSACCRAKFCELVAAVSPVNVSEREAFTAGLLSLVDAIIGQPMKVIMEALPLSNGIKDALVSGAGHTGLILKLAKFYERGCWDDISKITHELDIDESLLPGFYFQSCQWSNSIS